MAHQSNKQNLVDLATRSPEERRDIARKGAAAASEAKRRKRSRREWAALIGALPIKIKTPDGSLLDGADLDGAVVMAMYQKATKGDQRAARLVLELNGDLVQNINVSGPAPIVVADQKEAEAVQKALGLRSNRKKQPATENE